jgi:gamma-glutamylcysteine synthetase
VDPVTVIVTAVVLGASAGLQDTASQLVKDAYAGLKRLISKRGVDTAPVEAKPESAAKQVSLAEDLTDTGAEADAELLAAAREVISRVRAEAPEAGRALGVDLADIEAAALRVQSVDSEGTGVKVQRGRFSGDIEIGQVRAGKDGPGHPS